MKKASQKELQKYVGRRIRCDYMYDIFDSSGRIDEAATRMKGVCGTVVSVDDIGQLHVAWDNGSSLAINPEVDSFSLV